VTALCGLISDHVLCVPRAGATQRSRKCRVDPDPVRSSEANNQRPAVILSIDRANATAICLGRGVVTVVLVTRNTAKIHRFQVLLSAATSGLAFDSMARDEKVRSIATQCLLDHIGWVTTH
jgi:mRNA interferase MazF